MIFQKASIDFGMRWNRTTYLLNKTVLGVAVVTALIWSVGLVVISYTINTRTYEKEGY